MWRSRGDDFAFDYRIAAGLGIACILTVAKTPSCSETSLWRLVAKVDETMRLTHENTEITKDVRDILGSFKVMMHIGKWVTVIASMFAAIFAAWKSGRCARRRRNSWERRSLGTRSAE